MPSMGYSNGGAGFGDMSGMSGMSGMPGMSGMSRGMNQLQMQMLEASSMGFDFPAQKRPRTEISDDMYGQVDMGGGSTTFPAVRVRGLPFEAAEFDVIQFF